MTLDRARVFGEHDGHVERIAPGHFEPLLEKAHLARYRWAARRAGAGPVLDVACGTGYGSAALHKPGRSVTGVDLHHAPLAFARAEYPGPAHVQADGCALPFPDGAFATVVSMETLEHFGDPAAFLTEVARVLAPGGRLLLSTPNAELSPGGNHYHPSEVTGDQLESLLAGAGFEPRLRRGQHWRRRRPWPAAGRLADWVELHPGVRRGGRGADPVYFCVEAERSPALTPSRS